MEERLLQLKIQAPPPGLKSRIMTAVRREARITVWDRLWASKLFWCGSCAAIAACLLLAASPPRPQPRPWGRPKQTSEPAQLARCLAEMVGDAPELERWLALRLDNRAGRRAPGGETYGRLLEEFTWQG